MPILSICGTGTLIQGGPKTAQWTSLGEISAKRWPKTVIFRTVLAATLMPQWRAQSTCIITFKITVMLDSFKHSKLWQCTSVFTVSFTVSVQCVLLVAGRRTPAATPFVDGAVNEPLREFARLSDHHRLELLDSRRQRYTVYSVASKTE